jgi:UDP-N-acetylglucosamine:LPS N-acetylglucosamine transferase
MGRDEARARLGLDADGSFALVVAGAWGVGHIERTVEAVAAAGFHPITVCGSHSGLWHRLTELGLGTVLGWTDEMPTLMAAANVLVENAGGLSSMEAFATGLPVVTYCPIAGHGRHNAEEMERAGLTTWAKTPEELDAVLRGLAGADQAVGRQAARCLFGVQPVATVIDTGCAAREAPAPRGPHSPYR